MPSRERCTATRCSSQVRLAPSTPRIEPTSPPPIWASLAACAAGPVSLPRPRGWFSWPSFSSRVILASSASMKARSAACPACGGVPVGRAAPATGADSAVTSSTAKQRVRRSVLTMSVSRRGIGQRM